MMTKRMSINPTMVKQYSTLVRLQVNSEKDNPISETESIKTLKPSDSTMVKPVKRNKVKKKTHKNKINKSNHFLPILY